MRPHLRAASGVAAGGPDGFIPRPQGLRQTRSHASRAAHVPLPDLSSRGPRRTAPALSREAQATASSIVWPLEVSLAASALRGSFGQASRPCAWSCAVTSVAESSGAPTPCAAGGQSSKRGLGSVRVVGGAPPFSAAGDALNRTEASGSRCWSSACRFYQRPPGGGDGRSETPFSRRRRCSSCGGRAEEGRLRAG